MKRKEFFLEAPTCHITRQAECNHELIVVSFWANAQSRPRIAQMWCDNIESM